MFEILSAQTTVACFWSFIYAHGDLESRLGYDLIGSTVPAPEAGIHQAMCNGLPCLVFVWEGEHHKKGLAVDIGDKEGMEYAFKTYRDKSDRI